MSFTKSHNDFLTVRYILMPKIVGNASKTNTKVIQLGFATLANKMWKCQEADEE